MVGDVKNTNFLFTGQQFFYHQMVADKKNNLDFQLVIKSILVNTNIKINTSLGSKSNFYLHQ